MVRRKLIIGAGFGFAVCVLAKGVNAAQTLQTIKPGQSLGTITLGMQRLNVWKHIGRPTEIHFFRTAGRSYTWDTWREENNTERATVISRRGRVMQIEREYTEKENFPALRAQHPHLKVSLYDEHEDNGSTIVADDVPQGIAWTIYIHHYKDDEFNTHLLSEVGPDRVIVHLPGANALPNVSEISDPHDPSLGDIRAWFAAKPQKHNHHD